MNNKKDVAIVFGFTKNFVFAVACVMMDLKKFSPNWVDEVVILHDGISIKQQRLLNSILPCRFIKYEFPIKDSSKFNQKTLHYFSKMVFSKYECLKFLNDYRNVIWLDYDIVITQDISELSDYCSSGIKMIFSGNSNVLENLHKPVEGYKMDIKGICASTFVFQGHLLNYTEMYEFCYNKTEYYAQYLKLPEQAIFDFMIQDFKLNVCSIDPNIYTVHPNEIDKINKAKIIHTYGCAKFWNEIHNNHWNQNYKNYLKMGGRRYNLKKYLIKKRVRNFLRAIGIYENIKKLKLRLESRITSVFKK